FLFFFILRLIKFHKFKGIFMLFLILDSILLLFLLKIVIYIYIYIYILLLPHFSFIIISYHFLYY
ncbi:MAG: hypothetical protein MCS20_01220, partial [Candidatus Phytoplasma mali]|nr:hypothetical protein [Candidatus Phytoplasma australiense]MCG7202019.1 hypothetical protein [Candidatus Phytoplasma mali]MCZ8632070.1 hypothetical protein [Spiroplasma sp. Tabriz.8]